MDSAETELPLRIYVTPAGLLIRCQCGAESASVRGLQLAQDFSPAGLIKMVIHSRNCRYKREAML